MFQKHKKALVTGFLFDVIGLYILSALSLAIPFVESVSGILFAPIRFMSERFAGPDGSTAEVLLLSLGNGILYALLFFIVSLIIQRNKNN